MDIRDLFTSEHRLNRSPNNSAFAHQRIGHQVPFIVCPYRNETRPNSVRDHATVEVGRHRGLADKDRTGRPVRRMRRLMLEGQQQQLIADIRIA
jgi:hypothetical protein